MAQTVYCLTPVYNDWESFSLLAGKISQLRGGGVDYKIIVVNDGSTSENMQTQFGVPCTIINLKVNIGHQRAIAVGLQYIYNEINDAAYVIVMDSDGEDPPEQIPQLLEKAKAENNKKIVFAQRNKRQESKLFKTGYFFYRHLFKTLTGQKINFGNYSIIPVKKLSKVVHQNNIWNHYSGAIIEARIPYDKVLLNRGKRYQGVSKMKFSNLVLHGLSSIAVYFDFLSLKILRHTTIGISLCFISVLFIFYQKVFTNSAIPGWASSLIVIILGIILQLFSVTLIVLLLQLSSRKNIQAPNAQMYKGFIEDVEYYLE